MKKIALALMIGVGIAYAASNVEQDLVKGIQYRKAHEWAKAYKYFKKACDEGSSSACFVSFESKFNFESKYNEMNSFSTTADQMKTYVKLIETIHKSCEMKNPVGCFMAGYMYAFLSQPSVKRKINKGYQLFKDQEGVLIESCIDEGASYYICSHKIRDMVNATKELKEMLNKTPQEYINEYGNLACKYAKTYQPRKTDNKILKEFYQHEEKFIHNKILKDNKCIAKENLEKSIKQ